ncbi:repressor LexA [Oceanospirillum multiglobuliferum]|nr:repressor LexA [Oceanospirillum multiglobuliferum]
MVDRLQMANDLLFLQRSSFDCELWSVLDVRQDTGWQKIPLLGWVTAGLPMEICESSEQISVPLQLVKKQTYALKVRGDSMIEANINDGDIIIIEQRQSVESGETCVVMINNQQVTLKRLYIDRDGVRLEPANSAMSSIHLRNEDVQVLGIVMGLKRNAVLQ